MKHTILLCLLVGHSIVACEATPPASTAARIRLATPVLVIGQNDTSPGHDLYQVAGAVMLGDSVLIVADGGSDELRWFDLRGDLLFARGGQGGGATEFSALYGVWPHSDTSIAAFDRLRRRVSVWSAKGTLLGAARPDAERQVEIFGPLETGFVGAYRDNPTVRGEGDIVTDSLTLNLYGGSGEELGPIARLPVEVIIGTVHPVANRLMQSRMPLAPQGFVAANGKLVAYGFGADTIVNLVNPVNHTSTSIRVPWQSSDISAESEAAYKRKWLARVEEGDGARRRYVETFELPRQLPRFDDLLLDHVDRVWLRRTPDPRADSAEWAVFSPDGSRNLTFALASNDRVRYADSTHVVISTLADSVPESVRVYRLPR